MCPLSNLIRRLSDSGNLKNSWIERGGTMRGRSCVTSGANCRSIMACKVLPAVFPIWRKTNAFSSAIALRAISPVIEFCAPSIIFPASTDSIPKFATICYSSNIPQALALASLCLLRYNPLGESLFIKLQVSSSETSFDSELETRNSKPIMAKRGSLRSASLRRRERSPCRLDSSRSGRHSLRAYAWSCRA
jgi:hypothetical protein